MVARRESQALAGGLERLAARLGLELLTAEELAAMLTPVATRCQVALHVGCRGMIARPDHTLVAVEVAPKPTRKGLPDLSRVVSHLQRVVEDEAFVPWGFLACFGRAELLYVHSRGEQLGELRRWFARHPLVWRLPAHGGAGVVVPIRVAKL